MQQDDSLKIKGLDVIASATAARESGPIYQQGRNCPALDSIDKRLPPEVWATIFSRLYPSQLSRLSMVNKTFNKIVSSLSIWSRIFFVAYPAGTMRLRTLRDMPESKSYMLYLCALSLYICECCLFMASCKADFYGRPKQHQAPMRILKTETCEVTPELQHQKQLEWTQDPKERIVAKKYKKQDSAF
ncbi:MAG: hypothetical protein J3R72DRAFT_487405 [Linnemannia gamsii]|nr:MAG: hypothetical protein J3R72DRAFT_487405 [Linnemannia gamsii]